ncbi:MAG: thiol reductant ABC exporter subunit CydC [Candidatus Nanopelagicaceae bacterium]|nr:thiol reductant ABC exporter subunit CydC [Candidatus Nanopelagicaceae bacterium]
MKRSIPYLLGASAYIAGLGLTITSAWLITTASFQPPIMTLGVAIVGVRFFGISRSVARYFERLTSHRKVFDQLTDLRVRLYESFASNPIALVRDLGTGKLVKRVVDDVERSQEYQLRITLPHIAALISLLVGVGLGLWINPTSVLITVPTCLLLLFFLPGRLKKSSEAIARRIEDLESEYASSIEQAAHGIAEAQLYGYLNERLGRTKEAESKIAHEELTLLRVTRLYQFISTALIGLSIVGLTLIAHSAGEKVPAVQISMLVFLPLVMFEAITAWYPNLYTAGKLLLARHEVNSLIDGVRHHALPTVTLGADAEDLVLRNVHVSWDQKRRFMDPISFHMKSGDCLVIRGRSGSGKSTLALALLGLLDYEGEILLNGHELRSIADISSHISGAIQSGHVFNTTLRENLKIAAPSATDSQLLEVLTLVELDSLLIELGSGLETILGEMGRALSGGEIKRLNLARALLSPAQILVLDEPTEHLDQELATRIENRLLSLGRILIVVTHSGWERSTQTLQINR